MQRQEQRRALAVAVRAAKAAGLLMRRELRRPKRVNSATQHDLKLELDVRCQKRIEQLLATAFPAVPVLGEEGSTGPATADARWVVDPIDGTVNFAYGIPHACVSIALQERIDGPPAGRDDGGASFRSTVGVVYDPFTEELWTALRGQPARLNGRRITVSDRRTLREAIVTVGFAKYRSTLEEMIPVLNQLVHRVRKIRIMGSAALALTYVATGRMDAYLESGIRLWDIAAGGLILECAGGDFHHEPLPGEHRYRILASNGPLRRRLEHLY
jgi:myo-inositol-1(or 4)-monophosphatase